MFKQIKAIFDYISIAIGIAAWTLLIFNVQEEYPRWIVYMAATCCLWYICYAIYLYIRRPLFDWHLIHGAFLRKVMIFVVLVPFLFTASIIKLKKTIGTEPAHKENYAQVESIPDKEDYSIGSLAWSVYYSFIDTGDKESIETFGSGWNAVITICGIFLLNGLLVSSIVGGIDSREEKWVKGEIIYNQSLNSILSPHYVIIGGNDMVASIVKQIFESNDYINSFIKPYIYIQTSSDVEKFRRELYSTLNEEQQQKIIIYYGNRNSEIDIKELCIDRAKEVFILGEETRSDDIESYHDTMNMECLKIINNRLNSTKASLLKRKDKVKCYVMFEYQTTFSVFQFYDLDKAVSSNIDFRPFNYYEAWAQKIFINKEIDTKKLSSDSKKGCYLPLEGTAGIKEDDDSYVHLFIVGMSRIGVAMGIEAAHLAHYPNYEKKKIRTKITFIDNKACKEKDFLMGRFKELFSLSHWRYGNVNDIGKFKWEETHIPFAEHLGGDFLDIEWEFINGGIEQSAIQDYILESSNPNARITIAVCLPESNSSHAAALYLDKRIYAASSVLQVLVYNRYGNSITSSFISSEAKHPYLNKLKSFGAPRDCFDTELLIQSEKTGNSIDERYNKIYNSYIKPAEEEAGMDGKKIKVKYKGKSQVANFWSNIYNGNSMWTKLRSIAYQGGKLQDEEIRMLADVEHNRWNIEQLLMNFRPLTQEEQKDVIEGKKNKEILKSEMKHLNICSNSRIAELKEVDVAARAYDEGLTSLLPEIYSQLK